MKIRSLILSMLLIPFTSWGQEMDSLVAQFNRAMLRFESISPFDQPTHIDSLNLSLADRAALLQEAEVYENTIEALYIQGFYGIMVDSLSEEILKHPELRNTSLASKLEAGVVQSDDRRYTQIYYFENSGGTYQSRIVHFRYQRDSSKTHSALDYMSMYSGGDEGGLDPDGYHSMQFLQDRGDTSFYLFTGGVRGCSYCFSSSVGILGVSSSGMEELEIIEVESRHWDETISLKVDEKGDTLIDVFFEVDDLTGTCYCSGNQEENSEDREEPSHCSYRFQLAGVQFKLLESSCLYNYIKPEESEN